MEDMIKKGYAEKSVKEFEQGKTWFIPHHSVHHASKPGNIPVVFDCKAEYAELSLIKE